MSPLSGLVDSLSSRLFVSGVSIELTQHRFRQGAESDVAAWCYMVSKTALHVSLLDLLRTHSGN